MEKSGTYSETALALGRWLSTEWKWDAFATLTFAPVEERVRPGARRIDRAIRMRGAGHDWSAVGVHAAEWQLGRWLGEVVAKRRPGAYWWFAIEAHKFRTTPHFHGLIGGIRGDDWSELHKDWSEGCGLNRIVPVNDAEAAAVYVAKYVNKGLGKIYTSSSLGEHSATAHRLTAEAVAEARRKIRDNVSVPYQIPLRVT